MAAITIKYGDLGDAADYARKLSQNLSGYADEIRSKVTTPIGSLPGSDKNGYSNNAAYSANRKIRELHEKSGRFSSLSKNVEQFVSTSQQADETVARSIKSTASSYVGKRSKWQGFSDFLWNTICVDAFNGTTIGRLISDCVKKGWGYATQTAEKVRDWFKHGDGMYVWNIVAGVVATVGAIAGAITAIAAVIAGGPVIAIVLAVVAAIAAVVGAVITTVNSGVKIYNNAKALKSDDPGVSRYLGTIGSYSDATKKYDMGDAEDNKKWETSGKIVDTTKTVCDVIGIIKGVTDLGAVKDNATGVIKSYKFDKKTMMYNIKKSMGFKYKTNSKTIGKYTSKSQLGSKSDWDITKTWFKNQRGGTTKFLGSINMSKRTAGAIKSVVNTANVIDKAQTTLKSADSIYDRLKTGFDFSSTESTLKSIQSAGYTIIEAYETLGNIKLMKGINAITVKPFRTTEKVIKRIEEWSGKTIWA